MTVALLAGLALLAAIAWRQHRQILEVLEVLEEHIRSADEAWASAETLATELGRVTGRKCLGTLGGVVVYEYEPPEGDDVTGSDAAGAIWTSTGEP